MRYFDKKLITHSTFKAVSWVSPFSFSGVTLESDISDKRVWFFFQYAFSSEKVKMSTIKI